MGEDLTEGASNPRTPAYSLKHNSHDYQVLVIAHLTIAFILTNLISEKTNLGHAKNEVKRKSQSRSEIKK